MATLNGNRDSGPNNRLRRTALRANEDETKTLATLRDALTRLVSGNLRVQDAEGFAGRVA